MSKLQYTTINDCYELRKAHANDAGYDLVSARYVVIEPGFQARIDTPFCVLIPHGFVGLVKDRSSVAVGHSYTHAGVIDSGYTGRVEVLLKNDKPLTLWQKFLQFVGFDVKYHDWQIMKIDPGDKIAQLLVVSIFDGTIEKTDILQNTERGEFGFGSTGK